MNLEKQIIQIVFMRYPCWKCKNESSYVFFLDPDKTTLNEQVEEKYNGLLDRNLWFHPAILAKVNDFLKSEKGKHIKLATIKKRYSYTMNKEYISFGCNKCDSIFGEFHLKDYILNESCFDDFPEQDKFSFEVDFEL